nr:hypothetical protein Iba_chr04fCG11780 [Ipomoea batatas]
MRYGNLDGNKQWFVDGTQPCPEIVTPMESTVDSGGAAPMLATAHVAWLHQDHAISGSEAGSLTIAVATPSSSTSKHHRSSSPTQTPTHLAAHRCCSSPHSSPLDAAAGHRRSPTPRRFCSPGKGINIVIVTMTTSGACIEAYMRRVTKMSCFLCLFFLGPTENHYLYEVLTSLSYTIFPSPHAGPY